MCPRGNSDTRLLPSFTKRQLRVWYLALYTMTMVVAAIFIVLILSISLRSSCTKRTLNLLVLLPYFNSEPSLNPSWPEGDNIFPAILLARDQVNNHSTLLQNFSLNLIRANSGCQHITQTMLGFVEEAYHNESRTVVGLLGPGCSSSSIALGPVTNRSEVGLVMLHGSGSPILANRSIYYYQLGTLGSAENFINAIVYLLQKWDEVAVFYDESRQFYSDTKSNLVTEIHDKVKYTTPVSFLFLPLQVIRQLRLRVVIVLCPPELTRRIICLSWDKKMTYSNYQYVYTAHREQDLVQNTSFAYEGREISCSKDDMQNALNNQFLLVYNLMNPRNHTLDVLNISVPSYIDSYCKYIDVYNQNNASIGRHSEYSLWATYFYDSVWAWALVLDNLTREDPAFFHKKDLRTNNAQASRILEQFYQINFEGISGNISFDNSTGYTHRSIKLIQPGQEGPIGQRGKTAVLIKSSDNRIEYFAPIQIPSSFPTKYIKEDQVLSWFAILLATLLLLVTSLTQVLVFRYRHDAAIKATTPKLLHLSYTGVYIMLLGLITYSLYSATPLPLHVKGKLCSVLWIWAFPIGFSLALGPVAMRTWRLYRIFIHYTNPGRFINNKFLICGVLSLFVIDITVASVWTGMDQMTTHLYSVPSNSSGTRILHEQVLCTCSWYWWWLALVLTNKALLLLYTTTLAILTRKIKNLSFETNSLRILTYIFVIICALGISLTLILSKPGLSLNYSFTTLAMTILSLNVVLLICVFLPPLLPSLKPIFTEVGLVYSLWKKNKVEAANTSHI